MTDRIRPPAQSRVMSKQGRRPADPDDGQRGGGGHRHGRGSVRRQAWRGKTGTAEVDNATANQAWFIGFAPLDKPKMAVAVTIERTQGAGRHRGRADRQAGAGGAPRWRCPLMAEVADEHGGRRALQDPRAGSARAGWPTSTAPRTRTSAARWRSRCSTGASPRTPSSWSASGARPSRRRACSTRTWSGSTTAASTTAPTTSRWSTCAAGRSRTSCNDEAPLDQLRVIDLGTQILQAAAVRPPRGVIHRDFKPHNVIVDDAGPGQGHRLRHRPRGRLGDDGDGVDHGHGPVPVARAGAGPAVTARVRPVFDRRSCSTRCSPAGCPSGATAPCRSRSSTCRKTRRRCRVPACQIEPNLESVVMGALAKDPAARWQSADDFAEALEACRPYVVAQARTPPTEATRASPPPVGAGPRPGRRRASAEQQAPARLADRRARPAGPGADRGDGVCLHPAGGGRGAEGDGPPAEQGARPAGSRRLREGQGRTRAQPRRGGHRAAPGSRCRRGRRPRTTPSR